MTARRGSDAPRRRVPTRDRDLDLLRGVPDRVSGSWWQAAAWTGAGAAVVGTAIAVAVAVACWLPNAGASGRPVSAIRAGALAFLSAQRGGIDLDGTRVAFVPLAMTLVVAVIGWRASNLLADVLDRRRRPSRTRVLAAAAVQSASYAAACAAIAVVSPLGSTSVPLTRVTVASALLFAIVTATSLAWTSRRRRWWPVSLPGYVWPGLQAAAGAVCVYLGAGALLVAGSLVAHAGQVTQLSRMVGGGLSGIPLLVIGVLCAPNATVAGAAYLAGPGFSVGTGTAVTAFATSHGTLPAFPLLGAIPSGHGAPAVVRVLLVLTVFGAGGVAVRLVRRGVRNDIGELLCRLTVAAAGAGAAMAALGWLSGGAVGSGRLRLLGPSPGQLGLAVAGEIATVSLLIVAGSWLVRWLPARVVVLIRRPARRSDSVAAAVDTPDADTDTDMDTNVDDEDAAAVAG